MANRRQSKKNKNAALKKEINANINKLTSMQEKFSNLKGSGLEEELANIKKTVSSLEKAKKNKGDSLQKALSITKKELEREQELTELYHKVKDDNRKAKGTNDDRYDNGAKWSYIKEYHDLVNEGLITPWRTEQQVYSEAPFLLDDILSEDYLKRVVERGREKAQKLLEKNRERQSKIVAFDF